MLDLKHSAAFMKRRAVCSLIENSASIHNKDMEKQMNHIEALRGIKFLLKDLDNTDIDEEKQRFLLGIIQSTVRNALANRKSARDIKDKSPTDNDLYDILRKSGVTNPEQLTQDQLEAISQGISTVK